jgi:4-hydroxybenzoate polyprenyltransferase
MTAIFRFLNLIRFSHTIFALPFALGALLVAANGYPSPRILLLVLVCMICARTSAMLFNRLTDWSLDQRNPRTATRHLLVSRPAAITALLASAVAFLLAAAAINYATAWLAPLALALIVLSRLGPGRGAGRRVDRANRASRSCAADPRRWNYLLGGRLRFDLRHPGL